MNKDIGKFETALYEIQAAIANNEDVRKLLFYNTPDALNRVAPTVDAVLKDNNLVSLYPVIDEGIITTDRDCAIALDLSSVDTDFDENDHSIYGTLTISVLCTDKILLLDNKKFRIMEIVRNLTNTLDGFKSSLSAKLVVTGYERFINRHYYGAAVKVLLTDDATEVNF